MAVLTDTARTIHYADRRTGQEWWQYEVDCGTTGDEWSLVNLLVPSNVLDCEVKEVVLRTINAPATARTITTRERASIAFNKGAGIASAIMSPMVLVSDEIADYSVGFGAAADAWVAKWVVPPHMWIGRDDFLTLVFPPTDANGTPTADAICFLAVNAVNYTKR